GVMLAVAAAAGVRVLLATRTVEGAGANAGITAAEYCRTQGVMILRYLAMLILPSGYSVDPPVEVATPLPGALAWALVIGMAAVALRRFSRAREGFWFLAGLVLLLPSSSIFPVADLAVDRRMYIPLAAFSAAAALLIRNWRWPAAAALCIAFAAISFFRTQVWLSERTLWEEAARLAPSKLRPKIQLARVSEPPRALEILRDAKNLAPEDPRVASELGRVHLEMKNPARALQEYGRALALDPNDARAVSNRGAVLLLLAQKEAARADFERALRMDPCLADARNNLSRLGIAVPEARGCRE
ncbi:MAG: tetratricopeptide repeat protein, partial [Bryobacteraceae bacterium]